MTAEVCIMNRLGVALAADSAVTLASAGDARSKVYNSADKLFLLSEHDPVGVMIYGAASVVYLPWETIIKTYRHQISGRKANVSEYATDFLSFLEANLGRFFSQSAQKRWSIEHVHRHLQRLRSLVRMQLDRELLRAGGAVDPTRVDEVMERVTKEVVQAELTTIRAQPDLQTATRSFKAEIKKSLKSAVANARERSWGTMRLDKKTAATIDACVLEGLAKSWFANGCTGVAIAGFGTNDIFPALADMQIDGVLLNVLRVSEIRYRQIGDNINAMIVPFAQSEMVSTFMNGIDPGQAKFLDAIVTGILAKLPHLIEDEAKRIGCSHSKEVGEFARETSGKLLAMLKHEWEKFGNEYHHGRIMEMVKLLPKDELAAMAESLVSLTSFKRRVTRVPETVGGPVDVAVVTKGDGFVWIKRKHYFKPELNPRMIGRLRGGGS